MPSHQDNRVGRPRDQAEANGSWGPANPMDPYSLSPFGGQAPLGGQGGHGMFGAHGPFPSLMAPGFMQHGMGGSLGGDFMQQMQCGSGGAGGGSYCFSSCSYYSSSGGPNGQSVNYSSTTTGAREGNAPMVSETQQEYRDSSGLEKLGVARRVGERGRAIVAERQPGGEERKVQTLMHVEDASAFDREWQERATVAKLPRAADVAANIRPALSHAGSRGAPSSTRPALTSSQRRASNQDRAAQQQQQLPGLRLAPGHR
ncbi:hypothetical protein KFE25_007055 [Diacronema lutheri]|uniref:Uncharacterized protein n=1 Tax=Diacronema lutheri TaxID=2081491 RepID=A0A8J5XIA3_DIALT|nr:hypothetical protein KFE25_007055 [Diacronema lutheri]